MATGWYHTSFHWRKMSTHARRHVVDFQQSHWLRGKSPRNVVKMKEEMAAFLVSGSVVGQFVATRKLFWSKFLVVCVA